MAEIIEAVSTFIREYPWVVLGIMALGVLWLIVDRELTVLCPVDESAMQRADNSSFRCNKCGFVKRI